jgi:hypothetical protein
MQRITLAALVAAAGIGASALVACDAGKAPSGAPAAASEAELQALRGTLASALAERDPFQRVHRLATALEQLPPGAGPELKHALVEGSRTGMNGPEFELLARAWAAQDPEGAVNWLLTETGSIYRISAIEFAVEAYARKNPADCVANVTWAAQSSDREVAQVVQQGIVRGWFQVDRPGVEKYIEGLGMGVEQQRSLLAYLMAVYRTEGTDGVMRWAEALPAENDRFKRAVYRQVAMALAWADPAGAERWCDAQCEGPYGKALRSTIVRVRLQNSEDGIAVLEWVGKTPQSESQLHALRVGFLMWATKDHRRAMRWYEQKLAEGPEPEPWIRALYGAYARELAVTSPAEAIPWAEKIEGDETRHEVLVRIARRWRRQDQTAADAWIDKSELTEKERASARDLSKPDYLPEPREQLL